MNKEAKPKVQTPDEEEVLLHDARVRHHADRVAEIALAGTVAGAATGALAGPPGALVGAVVGGIAGAIAGEVMDEEDERVESHDRELDETIGVTQGNIGEPELVKKAKLPPPEGASFDPPKKPDASS